MAPPLGRVPKTSPDRRREARTRLIRPVKVRCDQSGARYLAGTTQNVSPDGAMLQLNYPSRLALGQRVRIAIARHRSQSLLNAHEMMDATIVRSLGHGRTQHVAIQFRQAQSLAKAV